MSILYRAFFSDRGEFGVAYADRDLGLIFLPRNGCVDDWTLLTLELRKGHFADYLANDLGFRLCSARLREIIERSAALCDELQWLPAQVFRGDERHPYFILHFPNPPDVIQRERSILVNTLVVKPVFDKSMIAGHQVFSWVEAGETALVVTKSVKAAIEAQGCTGITFSRTPTA